jgi:hypothetical protein
MVFNLLLGRFEFHEEWMKAGLLKLLLVVVGYLQDSSAYPVELVKSLMTCCGSLRANEPSF